MTTWKHSLRETFRLKLMFRQLHLDSAWLHARSGIARAKRAARRWYAMQWQHIYGTHYRISLWTAQYRSPATSVFLILLIVVSGILTPTIQGALEPYFLTEERFSGFRTLLVTLGGSLIGAAAIAFSLVMFAMQVNVERMPHGLFRKFSSDPKLLGAFSATFFLAIAVAGLSLAPDRSWLAVATLIASWGTVLILVLFLYAYRRALSLISPTQQLALVVADVRRDLRAWLRRARRAAPLLERSKPQDTENERPLRSSHDLPRATYFRLNPHWTTFAQKAILHSISFARRYAKQGDHEVSGAALGAVIAITTAYIEAKGKTFFTNHVMFDNPLARDGFINDTLEHLRQNVRIGISRGDEQQIEQTVKAMAALCRVFLNIDYATEHASKTHAHLAALYLSNAVQSVVPHDMPDVLMEGVRLMGEVAHLILSQAGPDEIAALTGKIATVSCAGIVKEDYRPVTLTGVEQLAKLTFELIRSGASDIHFAVSTVRENVNLVAKLFLKLPDTPLSSIHSSYLAPYYSCTSSESLQAWLTKLVDALANAKADNEAARRVIRNIEQWADGLYQTEKEIFLAALETRSHFTFDVVHWIAQVTKLLLAVSNVPACDGHARDELRRSALWLVSVFSWVPDDKETVTFVESFRMTDTLFDAAMDAHARDCNKIAEQVYDLLFSWAFKAGKYETGWAILERACYGIATLDLMWENDGSSLIAAISERLAKQDAPPQAVRDRAAREIRKRAGTLYHDRHGLSHIEYTMRQIEERKLRPVLEDIANRLSSETANEIIQLDVF